MKGTSTLAQAARAFALRGWHIFPLAADTKGRAPDGRSSHLLAHGHKDASADILTVKAWWQRWPDANIGLNLAASGLVAIDLDLYKSECEWDRFAAGKHLPSTFVQESARGGRHYVFKAPSQDEFRGQICPGVDIKHDGYILLAPSTFEGQPYRIASDVPAAPCPEWVPRKGSTVKSLRPMRSESDAQADEREVAELLSYIDPDADGYSGWIEVLQAIHSHFEGGTVGLNLATDWSRPGSLFRAGEIEEKWAGFDINGGVRLNSVAHRAKRNGADLSAIARKYRGLHPASSASHQATRSSPDHEAEISHDRLSVELGEVDFDRNAKFVATQGQWYFWGETHWRADRSLEHLTRIRNFLRTKAQLLLDDAGKTPAASVTRRIDSLKSHKTVSAVAALARSNPLSVASAEAFDHDLLLLGTPAGTVDLRTGQLNPSRRSDLITRQSGCAPTAPNKVPVRWLQFLDEIMMGDSETIAFLQRAAGYALTGCTSEHKLLFLHGVGRNGKSVFLNTLLHIWGNYGRRVSAGTFLSSHTERHPTDVASLRGARLAIASELPRGKSWDEAVIKDLTGGDRMVARFMRQDFFEFDPQLTLMIAGNVQPSFRGVDVAIRSRVVLVPFDVSIPAHKQDRRLPDTLKSEAPEILRWCIEGALKWQEVGLAVPDRLATASKAYFDDEDIVGQFLSEKTVDITGAFVAGSDLIANFNHWLGLEGLSPWTKTTLMKELRARGYEDDRKSTERGLKGLKIK